MSDRFIQSEIRQKLIEALRTDLIGPRKGEEEVLDENPELSYLTGCLHTVNKDSKIEFDDQEDIELQSGDAGAMGEEDNEDKYAVKFKQQASFGLSFYLADSTNVFTATLEWGDYFVDKREEEYADKKTGEVKTANKRVYTRFPRTARVKIDLSAIGKSKEFELSEVAEQPQAGEQAQDVKAFENIKIKVSQYSLKNGYKLVSLYATNHRKSTESMVDGIMFQVKLIAELPKGQSFAPEYLCRKKELPDEYLYESRPIFGRGHGCAADWTMNENRVTTIFSQFIPEHEIPSVSPQLDGFSSGAFLMKSLMQPKNKADSIKSLTELHDAYCKWIESLKATPKAKQKGFEGKLNEVIGKCKIQAERIKAGINLLETNEAVFDAFCFMNQCMFMQRAITSFSREYGAGVKCNLGDFIKADKSEWRPFQIAFVLLNLSSIVDYTSEFRKYVDLLYFPTGGGKTEAYLGLMAFLMGYRRMTAGEEKEYNKDGGTAIILRYTLRLLTTQQRDRLTKMVIAAEIIRNDRVGKDNFSLGREPFSVGFYVGGGVTPNNFSEFLDTPQEPQQGQKTRNKIARQLLACPFCGKDLTANDFVVNTDKESIDVYCSDKNCYFTRYLGSDKQGVPIPVYLVDEQIYRKCPTVIIATVDKFARLPWDPACNSLFGRVDRYCPRHGFIATGKKHEERHSAKGELPAVEVQKVRPFFPPELIVQDELHLITGPLGTIYGGYEAAIEELCSITKEGKKILPKYIVSTATIRNAEEQIRCLYGRKDTLQFPSDGLDIRDSFFTREVPIEAKPFRKYCGISASGKSLKTTELRVYAILLQKTLELSEDPKYKDLIDPYYTLIGYFNSIRELGGTVRLLQDDIPKRIKWIKKHYGNKQERFIKYKEITSRMTSDKIAGLLKELETTMDNGKACLDVAIATNMISVGLDIDRLGLMCVFGQPKQSSEYIQTTSRIGRSFPGLVVTIYSPYRPRDLSHYENFKGYHSHIYRFVEGTTATPFSARARDRVLHALFISLLRLQVVQLAENEQAQNIGSSSLNAQIDEIMKKIARRVARVSPKLEQDVIDELKQFVDDWKTLNTVNPATLHYYLRDTGTKQRLLNYYGQACGVKEKATLSSMREVENASTLYFWGEV